MPLVEREVQQVNLQRSLVIGLGGSGAEVVKQLRRALIDRFGRFENIPIVRFLYIDTDPNWLREMASEIEEDIQLPDAERVDAQVPDATELYQRIRDRDLANYSWLSLEKLESHKSVTAGAGTIRQLGRLCFWYHYSDIREKMQHLIHQLNADTNAQFMFERYGVVVDPGVNVHVIAGLAGGTGSGTFLDTAYLARHCLRDIQGAHQLVGYLMLPDAFRDLGGANALPNGYAALKELNYFSYMHRPDGKLAPVFGKPVWDADYTGDALDRVRYQGQSPFEFCYLLDARNPKIQLHRKDIFAMVARSLFHEFTLSFATFKRSLRANIKNRISGNDGRDCPKGFMSFGQSAVFVPREEILSVLKHQLALRAVQQWTDRTAAPAVVYQTQQGLDDAEAVERAVSSISEQAETAQTVSAVRQYLIRQFIPSVGLLSKDVLNAIITDQRERLVDVPYSLREAQKQRWIAENWPLDRFEGEVTDAWKRWKADFNDEGPDPMQWGEQIRKLVANRGRAETEYRRVVHERAFSMFEDTAQQGPAWTICAIRQLRSGLKLLKEQFVKEANDPVTIANVLGDVYMINEAAGGKGPSLSSIIETRIGQEFSALDKEVRRLIATRERVSNRAYLYLTWCAHWCRARMEERARRLAAELVESLINATQDVERDLLGYARTLMGLQSEILKVAREWNQKAARTPNIGQLLYDPAVMTAIEAKIRERQGDQYDPAAVGQAALRRLGKNLRDIRSDQLPRLVQALVDCSSDAIGSLDEDALQETRFAAYDLLCDMVRDNNKLDQILRKTVESGVPFVMLSDNPEGGQWSRTNHLLEIGGVGMRGGYSANDPDPDRARINASLRRLGWDPNNMVQPIDDSSQIVFFQECGGYPLRALRGIEEMRTAYEEERSQSGPPLHIIRDEAASVFPDIIPPKKQDLDRALMLQTVCGPLGFFSTRKLPRSGGTGDVAEVICYMRMIEEIGEEQPVPLGATIENVGVKLSYDPVLLEEVEQAVDAAVAGYNPEQKLNASQKLKEHLEDVRETLRTRGLGVDPTSLPEYRDERDRVLAFMQKHRLSVAEANVA